MDRGRGGQGDVAEGQAGVGVLVLPVPQRAPDGHPIKQGHALHACTAQVADVAHEIHAEELLPTVHFLWRARGYPSSRCRRRTDLDFYSVHTGC